MLSVLIRTNVFFTTESRLSRGRAFRSGFFLSFRGKWNSGRTQRDCVQIILICIAINLVGNIKQEKKKKTNKSWFKWLIESEISTKEEPTENGVQFIIILVVGKTVGARHLAFGVPTLLTVAVGTNITLQNGIIALFSNHLHYLHYIHSGIVAYIHKHACGMSLNELPFVSLLLHDAFLHSIGWFCRILCVPKNAFSTHSHVGFYRVACKHGIFTN